MKKRIAAMAAAVGLLFSGCNTAGADIVINADGYEGILASAEDTAAAAVPIPSAVPETAYTTADAETVSEESGEEPNTESAESAAAESRASETESADTAEETQTSTVTAAETETASTAEPPMVFETGEISEEAAVSAAPETTAMKTETTTTTAESSASEEAAATPSASAIELPAGSNSYRALNYSEVKGVWISYLELTTILMGKTESGFTDSIRRVYKNCADMGLNTVYVHVRSHGDAYYKSAYYPWSKYVTGTFGQAPDFDPLKIMIDEAHALGLSFQAWINPYRLNGVSEIKQISADYPVGEWYRSSEGERVVAEGSYYYLNPGYAEANELIAAGAKEIVANYNVDGIHIDDYFYPTTDKAFDSKAFAASGYSSLYSFRTDNCTKMVRTLYNAVKEANGTVLFGVAPQGNINNNYDFMYADVKAWCAGSGYIDYIMPQIYFGFKNAAQPYKKVLSDWQDMVSGTGVKLIPGLGVYKIGNEDSYGGSMGRYEWQTDTEIIKRQIEASEGMANYGGFVLYSYNHVFDPDTNASAKENEMAAVKYYIN
ncbi:MAG: family 10 glycosylhydrolase [Bacteroides sp.]|nr:family 10 glycosylhydrolase [Bacteroides sp.]